MAIDGEPAKILLPYLQRADELQKHDHLAAYYCRLYAMEKGLKIPAKDRTNETKLILISLMNQLEKDKKVVKLSPDDNMYMEGFALRVFTKADKQDRAGRADLKTAMTFYAASIFFEVLLQFGALPPDIMEKQKYSSWKAADIRKAVSEGRKPVPGPQVTENDTPNTEEPTFFTTEGHTSTSAADMQPAPSSPPPHEQDSSFAPTYPAPSSHASAPPPLPPPPPSDASYPKSFDDDFHLPSAPSNPIPPSYSPNPYAPSDPDAAGYPPSDRTHTVGTYSYPTDPPGYTTSPPPSFPSYSHQDSAHYHQPQSQPPPWPSSNSHYPPVFPPPSASGGYPASAAPLPGASRHAGAPVAVARTSSLPVGAESNAGYQLNGNYDSDYKPSPGQVVEAHKASRFAVSALAFDDVPTAISFLRKSLELLTSPSAAE